MNQDNTFKQYELFKIPDRQQFQDSKSANTLPPTKSKSQSSLSDGLYYEIEYDNSPIKGAGKFVLKSQKIIEPERDEIRELFYKMRDIASQSRTPFSSYSKFYDSIVQRNNARIFYKQAVFMKDFEDDYAEQVPFSSYFPFYQMLGYEQLRTYFTWRTKVRRGEVSNISLSYVYIYLYELLNNVGVDNPQDGLDKLIAFWTSFRFYDSSVDKYIIRWLKDYHIYYNLSQSFKDFANEHNLTSHYPKITDTHDSYELLYPISKYDIRKSAFYTEDTSKLIIDCFNYIIERIRLVFKEAGINIDDILFSPTKKLIAWEPFKGALFHQNIQQPDRRVVISENEIYICSKNQWTFSSVLTSDRGRKLIGYVMKEMESELRKISKYKHKITANIDMIDEEMLRNLNRLGLDIKNIVDSAVMEYHREATKTVVSVDPSSLARIRQEALATQEALIVEEPAEPLVNTPVMMTQALPVDHKDLPLHNRLADSTDIESEPVSDIWKSYKDALCDYELQALAIILQGDNIKKFADDKGIMLEVLADGINEKAMDYISDNILDDELMIYEDYEEQVKGMVD